MMVSSDVFLLKPEEEIFKNLCNKYGIKPQESVFIDDTAENIDAANQIGFKAIHFKNPDTLKNELKSMGLLDNSCENSGNLECINNTQIQMKRSIVMI